MRGRSGFSIIAFAPKLRGRGRQPRGPFLRQDASIESGLPNLLLRADLHCLHAGFRFGLRFEGTIVYNRRGRCGWLGIYDRALFGSGIAHNVKLGRARRLSDERRRDDKSSADKIFFQGFLLL